MRWDRQLKICKNRGIGILLVRACAPEVYLRRLSPVVLGPES
jgi:hypothetical protein